MKAQILKIAGVKNEAEFYKKYPTEEAFMKKHGKQLEKAQSGIKKKFTVPQMTLNVDTSPQGLLNNYYNSTKQESIFNTPYKMGKSSNLTTGETTTLAPISNTRMAGNMLLNQAGTLVGLGQSIADKYGKKTDELNNYEKFSDMIAKMPAPKMPKPKYVRPEYSQVSDPQKYGVPMAQDGASVGGNPTEIQNTYNPYDVYTDLGYEPLNDSNPKQYQTGGAVANSPIAAAGGGATGGFDASQFMGAAGSLGGALGSTFAGDDFAQTEEGQLGSTLGGAAGFAIGGPVGGLIGSGIGGLAGGLIGGKKNKQMKFQKSRMESNLAAGAYTNSLQNGPLSAYAEDGTSIPSYEEGGYMNPEYNPQVIAKFGDYTMDQLLAPPHDADMLRAGGHLKEYTPPSARAMYTGRDLPYQMQDGGQMAMGGDLQVHRGKAETISYNPFLPNNGETVMFKGPSHANGGMPITFGQNGVEVEGGEPAQILQDGGDVQEGDDNGNLVVFGNMIADKFAAEHVGDYSIAGKRYKHIAADYSKQEVKANKVREKGLALINKENPTLMEQKMAELLDKAGSMSLKMIADKKMNLAAVQNAILDTAHELGVESDALAKGKIKPIKPNDPYAAEFGAKLKKGGKVGKKKVYDPEFENFINQAMMLEQANSNQQIIPAGRKSPIGGVYRGGAGNYGTAGNKDGQVYNTPEKAKEYYYKNYWSKVKDLPPGLRTRALQLAINTGDPYGELMVAAGKMSVADRAATKDQRKDKDITGNKDWEASKADILKAYNENPQAFLGKLDAEQDRYYDSYIANNPLNVNSDTRKEFFNDYIGLAKYASQPYIGKTSSTSAAATTPAKAVTATTNVSPYKDSKEFMSKVPFAERKKMAIANGIKGFRGLPAQNEKLFGLVYKPKAAPVPASAYLPAELNPNDVPVGEVQDQAIVNPQWMPAETQQANYLPGLSQINPAASQVSANPEQPDTNKKKKKDWYNDVLTGVNSMLPYLRPTNQMQLDPSQLSGEMLALATNQVEPVYAQSYQPQLAQPYSISLQDMRNQIIADARAAQRMAQGNPAAAAMIAAASSEAKNKINAEEFRANQGEQARVAELNRQTMNDAQMKNLAIFQDQAGKMSQARSNTKQQAIAALNSINDKVLKNKLENRTLGITENLYNYRFTPNGVAYNVNPAMQFAPHGSGTSGLPGKLAPGKDFSLDRAGNIIGVHSIGKDESTVTAKNGKSIKGVNGSIVKAIKNL